MQRPEASTFLTEVLSELDDLPENLAPRLAALLGAGDESARKTAIVDLFEELAREYRPAGGNGSATEEPTRGESPARDDGPAPEELARRKSPRRRKATRE